MQKPWNYKSSIPATSTPTEAPCSGPFLKALGASLSERRDKWLRASMRSLVIKTDDGRIVLVDNGAGNKHLKQLSYYRFFNLVDLGTELRNRGIQPEEITDVVLTHLHFDHCGYTTQKDESTGHLFLSFPNANHWVSRKQWENFLHPTLGERFLFYREYASRRGC